MERTLLYDGDCAACSPLAKAVKDLGVPGLHTRSLRDPELATQLSLAGLSLPTEPALLLDDDRKVRLLTGSRMRLHLARLLGVGRAREIAGLVAMEVRARRERTSEAGGRSRRRFLGTAGAAAGAAVVGSALGSAQPATAKPAGPMTAPADPRAVQALLTSPRLRQAADAYGQFDTSSAIEVSGGSEPIMAISHADSKTLTYVGMAPGKEQIVIAMRPLASGPGLEFLDWQGGSLGTLSVVGGKIVAAAPSENMTVAVPASQVRCWLICTQAAAGPSCIDTCWQCIFGSWASRPVRCASCLACGGPNAITCARECFRR